MNKPIREYKGENLIDDLITEINVLRDMNKILTKENEKYEKALNNNCKYRIEIKELIEESKRIKTINQNLTNERDELEEELHSWQNAYKNVEESHIRLYNENKELQQKLKKEEERTETYKSSLNMYHNLCDSYSNLVHKLINKPLKIKDISSFLKCDKVFVIERKHLTVDDIVKIEDLHKYNEYEVEEIKIRYFDYTSIYVKPVIVIEKPNKLLE